MKYSLIHVSSHSTPWGTLQLATFEGRLCLVDWTNHTDSAKMLRRLKRFFGAEAVMASSAANEAVAAKLDEYLAGRRRTFDLEIDIWGTPFQIAVRKALMDIPYGTTATYGEIASAAGSPLAVRATARAIATNPMSIVVPCHRVVAADGSLAGYRGGLEAKLELLRLERFGNPEKKD